MSALAVAAVAALGARPLAHAWEKYERAKWHAQALDAYNQLRLRGTDEMPPLTLHEQDRGDGAEEDDATIRRLYTLAYYGNQATPDVSEQRFLAAQREAARWPSLLPAARTRANSGAAPNAVVAGQSWVNLGPTDARIQANGQTYNGIDSGRAATIRVDPRDKDVVYLATAWGGLWKTYNFSATQPTWLPISDNIGALSVGAFEIDPSNPDTLYLGIGDALDTSVAGGAVYKSTDGGSSWTLLTSRLSGMWPAATGGRTENAVSIMQIAIDASDGNKLLVATDVGLFRSTDGGTTFTLAPLPTATNVEAKAWSIAYLGAAGGQSAWVVSGMYACATNQPPQPFGFDFPANTTTPIACAGGTLGDVWRSSDSGATWTSLRGAGKLPNTGTGSSDYGRIALAAGAAKTPTTTVIYAQVSNVDSSTAKQLAVWKSTDGGQTWTSPAGSLGTAAVTNPTSGSSCKTMDLAHGQSWYNLAIAVDPTNDNNVLAGGNLCGARTTNGGTSWSNVAHWLPPSDPLTAGGQLPYVHADWHAATIANVGGSVVAFAGSDGGFFASKDVFSAATGQAATWTYTDNRGIATHLFYGVSSGDPTAGDEQVVFGGLQDNGTRFRDLDPTMGKPTTFNQVVGGDGIGTALSRGPAGVGTTYFGSLPGSAWTVCQDTAVNCSTDFNKWGDSGVNIATTNDPIPFFIRYSAIDGDTTGAVLTATTYALYKFTPGAGGAVTAKRLSPAMTGTTPPHGFSIRNVYASPFAHTDCGAAGGQACRLYGIAGSGGSFAVFTDTGAATVPFVNAPTKLGIGTATNQRLTSTTGIAFPSKASNLKAGAHDGQVFIVTSTAPRMADGMTLVPDSVGRVFITTDGGTTWTPFHGNGTSDLPNVPAQTVVFDPSDTTDKTIFVGNDLGVYQTTDGGLTWHRYGVGFPLVRVTEIRIAKNSGLMRVATYGRGLWEIYPNAMAAPGVRGDGDWDANLAIDFLDLGAMATRLGDTPATATQPYYDWHLDMVGDTANSIGEDDLSAVLAKFGSHP